MVSAMHKQSAFTAMVTVTAVIGVVLWELGLQETKSDASAVKQALNPLPRADWSNYFEGALLSSILIACYIRFYASYYAIAKINRALSLGCILLFAAVVVVLVKTAPCGTAYETYVPCFEVYTGIAFGFALLDLVIFLVWKCLFHYNSAAAAAEGGNATIVVKALDVEAPAVKEVEVKTEAALEKEEEAKKEEEAAKAKKEEEAEETAAEEKKAEEAEEKEAEKEAEEEEQKGDEPAEAEPLLQEEKKEEEKKE